MTEVRDPALAALLAEARRNYAVGLPEKIAELGALVRARSWEAARRAAHKLRGSAGTYGFVALGDACGLIEDLLLESPSELDDGARARVEASLVGAAEEARRAAQEASAQEAS